MVGASDFFQQQSESDHEPGRGIASYFSTHPLSAERIEALYDDVATVQQEVQTQLPALAGVEEELFGGRTIPEQFAVLEAGERSGGKLWAQLAKEAEGEAKEAMLACVKPEEDNADALRAILATL